MKILLINLSPRQKGTSSIICEHLVNKVTINQANSTETIILYKHLKEIQIVLNKIQESDSIVFVGPCYVDSFPAETIHLLQTMSVEKNILHGQKIYGFIQGGMPYVHTHESGLKLLENFSNENGLSWSGGFVMGGGAALDGQSLDHVIGAPIVLPAIDNFADAISNGKTSSDEVYKKGNVKIPAVLALMLSVMMCRMIKKKYKKMGIDYKKPSPYLIK